MNFEKFPQAEGEPELEFDIEKEIGEGNWQKMKEDLEEYRKIIKIGNRGFVRAAAEMKIIFPGRVSELGLDSNTWEDLKKGLSTARKKSAGSGFSNEYLYNMKILFPEKSTELGLNEITWKTMKNDLDKARIKREKLEKERKERVNWGSVLQGAKTLKILFPEHASELGLDEEAWEGMKTTIEFYKRHNKERVLNANEQAVERGRLRGLTYWLSEAKILFPEKADELMPDEDDWVGMKNEFGEYSKKLSTVPGSNGIDVGSLRTFASEMKIIAAKEVKVGKSGLELVEGS